MKWAILVFSIITIGLLGYMIFGVQMKEKEFYDTHSTPESKIETPVAVEQPSTNEAEAKTVAPAAEPKETAVPAE